MIIIKTKLKLLLFKRNSIFNKTESARCHAKRAYVLDVPKYSVRLHDKNSHVTRKLLDSQLTTHKLFAGPHFNQKQPPQMLYRKRSS